MSSEAILDAWSVDEWLLCRSSCWEERVLSWRESFFRVVSASRMRRSRAWSRVEMESFTRPMASLSGLMLKLSIVWEMSWAR